MTTIASMGMAAHPPASLKINTHAKLSMECQCVQNQSVVMASLKMEKCAIHKSTVWSVLLPYTHSNVVSKYNLEERPDKLDADLHATMGVPLAMKTLFKIIPLLVLEMLLLILWLRMALQQLKWNM